MSNLDKDIEILKEFIKEVQEEYSETLVDGKVYRIENIPIEFKPTKELAQAIENVLSTLKREKAKIKVLSKINKEIFDEKETWKKIAEKLAEELEKCSLDNKEGLIDWARKEVENEI